MWASRMDEEASPESRCVRLILGLRVRKVPGPQMQVRATFFHLGVTHRRHIGLQMPSPQKVPVGSKLRLPAAVIHQAFRHPGSRL